MALAKTKSPRKYELHNVVEAFTIISKMLDTNECLGLTQLSDDTHISKNKTFRLLSTLEQYGIVEKNQQNNYKIGMATIGIARNIIAKTSTMDAVRPYMEVLARITGEAVYFASYIAGEAVFVDYVDCSHPVKATSFVGKRFQHPNGMHTVCETWLNSDVAVDVGGLDIDITTVSMPFNDAAGTEIGVLVVLAPTFRMHMDRIITEIAPALKDVMQRRLVKPANLSDDVYQPSVHLVEREYSTQPLLFSGTPQKVNNAMLVA